MKLVTDKMLPGACKKQRAKFRKMFPNGAPVTVAAARKAWRDGIRIFWAAKLLPNDLWSEYFDKSCKLWDEYNSVVNPFLVKSCVDGDSNMNHITLLYDSYIDRNIKLLVPYLRKA